jgi:hypothetical protein
MITFSDWHNGPTDEKPKTKAGERVHKSKHGMWWIYRNHEQINTPATPVHQQRLDVVHQARRLY